MTTETTATAEPMKEALEEAIAAWNRGDLDSYLELYDDEVSLHGYGPAPMDKAMVRSFYEGIMAGLPNSQIEVLESFAGGDRLAARFVQRGRHDGDLMGVPPTGRDVELSGMTILAFRDGKVVERWAQADMLGLLTQIGAIPPPGA